MMPRYTTLRLLLVGAAPRIAAAALIVTMLWVGFVWATASPGAL